LCTERLTSRDKGQRALKKTGILRVIKTSRGGEAGMRRNKGRGKSWPKRVENLGALDCLECPDALGAITRKKERVRKD